MGKVKRALPKNITERNGVLYVEMTVNGKRIKQTTYLEAKKENFRPAMAIRDSLRKEVVNGVYEIKQAERAGPDLGVVCDLVCAYERVCARRGEPTVRTVRDNVLALSSFCRVVTGKDDVGRMKVDVLSGKSVVLFAERKLEDLGDSDSSRVSINSILRKARGLFARGLEGEYPKELVPPDLQGFMRQFATSNPYSKIRANRRPPTDEEMRPLVDEAARMGPGSPIKAVWLLNYHLGMRSEEVLACRWSWFEPGADGEVVLVLEDGRDGERIKTNRRIMVSASVWAALVQCRRPDGVYVVQGDSPSARSRLVQRHYSAWIRGVVTGGRFAGHPATSHAVRAYRIQRWTEKYGDFVAMVWAGHSSINTTRIYQDTKAVRAAGVVPMGAEE